MSTRVTTDTTGTLRIQRMPRWFTGRSELIVVAGVLALAVFMTVGIIGMEVPAGTAFPGPQFFPVIVAIFLYAVGIALGITVVVSPQRAHVADDPTEVSTDMLGDLGAIDQTSEIRIVAPESVVSAQTEGAPTGIDWRTVTVTVGAIAAFIVALPLVGWLLAAAALFWTLSWAFGSKRPLFDIGIAVITSSIIQLAFGLGLGLSLPAGIMQGVFPWIS